MSTVIRDLALALDPVALMRRAGHEPDAWQKNVLRSQSKRQLLLCNRQAGKSTVVASLALHEALYNPPALILLLARGLRQSQELFRKVLTVYGSIRGELADDPERESALQMELENGSRIISLPGKEETVRSYSGVRLLILDEASRIPDALYYSVRPMLAVSGGRLICLSTPFGKRGFFYEAWEGAGAWEKTKITADQCPRISQEFLQEERETLGEYWYAQEYECKFVETTDQLFTYESIQAAFGHDVEPLITPEQEQLLWKQASSSPLLTSDKPTIPAHWSS